MFLKKICLLVLCFYGSINCILYAHPASFKNHLHSLSVTDTVITKSGCNCDVDEQIKKAAKQKLAKNKQTTLPLNKNNSEGNVVDNPKYLNPKLPIEERIDDLLPRLTLEEKVTQLSDSWGSKGIPRLKIPAMLKTEGLHGQSYATGSTIFPVPIAMSSTFDEALIYKVGVATAVEAKAANLRASWSPVLDVARDARWGRVEETYGEDPYQVSRMGVSWIKGFQSLDMIAIPKHFAGHGEPLGGRDSHDVGLSDRVMRNVHLVPFRAVIKEANAGGVMAAYSTWNGVPDNASVELLQKILREEWNFKGIVVSDCSGPENFMTKQYIAADLEQAARLAILAGVDIECGSAYTKALVSAVHHGVLQESDLDPNLRRVLRAKFKLGLFENAGSPNMVWDKLPVYDTPEHRMLAREVAVESTVLLKNDNKLLPLSKKLNTIAVIGPNADLAQTGDYSAKAAPGQLVSVLQGVKSHVDPSVKVIYAKGCDINTKDETQIKEAVDAAKQADAVILVVGDNSMGQNATTGENVDGATLEIPGVQRQLIKAIEATGKPVVLVLVNGKPFTLSWEAEHIPAILETWYPGEEGGNATADILFGDSNPSGRLPITFPRHVGQEPLYYNYEPSGRRYNYYDMPFTPLYRFGHGLSYTTFKYSNLQAAHKNPGDGFVTVSADVENTGNRDGDEVTQLYVTDMLTSVVTPVIELKGANRVSLHAGEKKTVTFELTPYQLSLLNADMKRVVEPGKFRVHIGGESPEPPAAETDWHKQKIGFTNPANGISGEFEVAQAYKADFAYTLKTPPVVKGGQPFEAIVTITNKGNLTDAGEVKLYGQSLLDTYRFELDPGQSFTHAFSVRLYKGGSQRINAIVGDQLVSQPVNVLKAPARLVLKNENTVIDDHGVLTFTAIAENSGSEPYKSNFNILIDGAVVKSKLLVIEVGGQQQILINYTFPRSGTFKIKAGNSAQQLLVVPGGIGLALHDPLIYLNFDDADGQTVKNEVTGLKLPVKGTPQYVDGKSGKAFYTDNKNTYINAGGLDIYRKPFTLAAWIKADTFDDQQAAFFGGQAPMGADVDVTGTSLAAGIFNGKTALTFKNKDVYGKNSIPLNEWTHIAYTYDPQRGEGSIYINGKLDKTSNQKPYAGPLDMIGSALGLEHGKFAMDEVLITRGFMSAGAIAELAAKGVSALRNADLTTNWEVLSSPVKILKTWAEIPAGASITVIAESAGDDGKIINSSTIKLSTGEQSVPLTQLKQGTHVRLRVQLSSVKWDVAPILQTAIIEGSNESIRWSTKEDWQKGKASGGLIVGQ
jgi:beta-glucosidase